MGLETGLEEAVYDLLVCGSEDDCRWFTRCHRERLASLKVVTSPMGVAVPRAFTSCRVVVLLEDGTDPRAEVLVAELRALGVRRILVVGVTSLRYAAQLGKAGVDDVFLGVDSPELPERLEFHLGAAPPPLKSGESRFSELVVGAEYVGEGIDITDETGRIVYVNRAFEELTGYSREQAVGSTPEALFGNELNSAEAYQEVWSAIQRGDTWRGGLISRRADGTLFHQSATLFPVLGLDGLLECAVAVRRDITVQVRAQSALKVSERRYRLLAENATDIIWTAGLDGWFTFCSPSVERVLGFTVEEVLEFTIADFLPSGSFLPGEEGTLTRPGGGAVELPQTLEVKLRHRDGRSVWCEVLVNYLRGGEGEVVGILGVSRDITARREALHQRASLEAQLQQSQKIEAIGRLAGGIAHDFNNLLTGTLVSAELLIRGLGEHHALYQDAVEIKECAQRAARLTGQLLAFGRKQVTSPKIVDVEEQLKSSLRMLERLLGEDIRLCFEPEAETARVRIDPVALEQIVVNLGVNSRDAMPLGGRLKVVTGVVEFSEEECARFIDASPGRYGFVEVADTGTGMAPEVRERAFEPFFTTKPEGRGTGLGLSTVYGICKQNKGLIEIDSEVHSGTVFRIFFPAVDGCPERLSAPLPEEFPPGAQERILVVEDQTTVRRVTRRILESQGYTVLEATHGEEALALSEARLKEVKLLLTDVIMPQVGGAELASKMRALSPELGVLFMSGHAEDSLHPDDLHHPATDFIRKPFTVSDLLGAVRALLPRRAFRPE